MYNVHVVIVQVSQDFKAFNGRLEDIDHTVLQGLEMLPTMVR